MTARKRYVSAALLLGTTLFLSACGEAPIKHPNRLRAAEHLGSAEDLLQKNHPEQAILSVKKALARHRISGDFNATISDMNRLARLSILTGSPDKAREWINRALLLESVGGAPALKAETLLLGAEIAPPHSASSWTAEAQKTIADIPGTQDRERQKLLSRLYQIQGERLSLQKHYHKAGELYRKALGIDESRGDERSQATDLAGMGRNELLSGNNADARKSFKRAREIDLSRHNPSGLAFDLEGLALLHLSGEKYRTAARELLIASGIHEALGHKNRARKDIESIKSFASHIGALPPEAIRSILDEWERSETLQE